jgi:hypothetical protein
MAGSLQTMVGTPGALLSNYDSFAAGTMLNEINCQPTQRSTSL